MNNFVYEELSITSIIDIILQYNDVNVNKLINVHIVIYIIELYKYYVSINS